jgi:AAA15 family ATPase/GTPase
MYVKKIEITNWRSIGEQPAVIKMGDITIIAGANDVGKTASIQASLSAFSKFSIEPEDPWRTQSLYRMGSRHDGSEEPAKAILYFALSDVEIGNIINFIDKDLESKLTILGYQGVNLAKNDVYDFLKVLELPLKVNIDSPSKLSFDEQIDYEKFRSLMFSYFGIKKLESLAAFLIEKVVNHTSLEENLRNAVIVYNIFQVTVNMG